MGMVYYMKDKCNKVIQLYIMLYPAVIKILNNVFSFILISVLYHFARQKTSADFVLWPGRKSKEILQKVEIKLQ